MKQRLRAIGIVFLSALTFSRSAVGQKTYALAVGGGAAIPVGKLGDTQKTGYNGIVALAMGVAELPIGVRFDAIYNNFSRKDLTSPPSNTYSFRIAGLLGNIIYAFPGTTAKTYIVAGGGLYATRLDVAGTNWDRDFGLNAGLGATFGLGPIAGFVESRYHFVRREPAKGGVIHFVPITLGIMF